MPNRIYEKVPVEIPNKSGFYEGHYNHFSGKTGTLVPCLTDLLIPNDHIDLSLSCQVQLPPMASDFFGHIDMKFEAFFVPLRLCYGGFQDMMTHFGSSTQPSGINPVFVPENFPYFYLLPKVGANPNQWGFDMFAPGTLADYLGVKNNYYSNPLRIDNPTPFIAYHLIWQEWYRNPNIQKPCFNKPYSASQDYTSDAAYIPYVARSGAPWMIQIGLNDGLSLAHLRQRNWGKDYFTNAKPTPQAGDASQLIFRTDPNTETAGFTIASLRAANSLQQWLERNNLAGFRYADQIYAHFGIRPSDAVIDRPIFIGQQVVPVYTKSISQTAEVTSSRQPFNSVGSQYGRSIGVGNGHLGSFHATEYGYIMVLASLVPRAIYSSGTRRYIHYSSRSDFATPLLSSIGDQPILKKELISVSPGDDYGDETFGYVQRYAEYKDMVDEVHGLLREDQPLSMFTLQRSFIDTDVQLGSSFIEIGTDFLDQVTAADSASSNFGYWCDVWFDYNKSSVLPAYSIPTLGDLKNTHTELISNGGTML